jgi:hypothetical protein
VKRARSIAALAALSAAAAALAPSAAAEPKPLVWDDVFSQKGAPPAVHLTATYVDGKGGSHDLELWRDADQHLRRRTDDRLDLYVDRREDGDYAYRLLDHQRSLLIEVSRTNLHRIGVFSGWPALAGMLTRPSRPHRLVPSRRPPARTPAGACRWHRVEIGAAAQEICWSAQWRLPLLIQAEAGPKKAPATTFRVKQIEAKLPGSDVFRVDPAGLAVVNADQDINPSSD